MKPLSNDQYEKLYQLLVKGIEYVNADKGLLQFYNREKEILQVVAHKGFQEDFLTLFKMVKAFDPTACGRALGLGKTVFIDDVTNDKALTPFLEIVTSAGFRAVISIPLFGEDKKAIGVISTHFKDSQFGSQKRLEIPADHLLQITGILSNLTQKNNFHT